MLMQPLGVVVVFVRNKFFPLTLVVLMMEYSSIVATLLILNTQHKSNDCVPDALVTHSLSCGVKCSGWHNCK